MMMVAYFVMNSYYDQIWMLLFSNNFEMNLLGSITADEVLSLKGDSKG